MLSIYPEINWPKGKWKVGGSLLRQYSYSWPFVTRLRGGISWVDGKNNEDCLPFLCPISSKSTHIYTSNSPSDRWESRQFLLMIGWHLVLLSPMFVSIYIYISLSAFLFIDSPCLDLPKKGFEIPREVVARIRQGSTNIASRYWQSKSGKTSSPQPRSNFLTKLYRVDAFR